MAEDAMGESDGVLKKINEGSKRKKPNAANIQLLKL